MTAMVIKRLFDWKVRGIRWIEIIGVVCVAVMVLSVYVAKTAAARESTRIAELEQQIAKDRQRVRLLRAEVARLEQPARLEALSRAAGLAPVEAGRRLDENEIVTLAPSADEPAEPAPLPPAVQP